MLREPLENRNGELCIDGVSARELAERFDTPLYVTSEKRVRENYNLLRNALIRNYQKIRIYYAAKANSNLSVLKILETEGSYLDAVSPGEVSIALKAGFPPERILFTGTSVRDDELKFLLDSNVTVNVDSLSQLDRLLSMAVPSFLSVRVNPEIGAGHHSHVITAGKHSKFGVWEEDALKAYETAKKAGVEWFGIHMHVGSGVLDVEPFVLALEKLLSIAKRVHEQVGVEFEFINMGGGLGVPYKPEDKELDLALFSDTVLTLFKRRIGEYGLGKPFFCVEPGRYLVCDASVLLTAVNTVKTTPFKKFVGVDAGFNTLVRPTMYGAYHPVLVAGKLGSLEEETYDVVGPICESGDVLARDRRLPKIEEGDLLAVLNAGAYGFAMSSQYNARPRAAEVLVMNGKYALVRERETVEDLLSGQRVAEWLQ
ncbi:MAG TPA: diaminopimelate decarboxylase [Candidatus Bathyarchaeia archaeon]|nr:diaminopimelate decarboxylase [Candidatus Bathyarchaeia archaeon]